MFWFVLASGVVVLISSLAVRRVARTPPPYLKLTARLGIAIVALGTWPLLPLPAGVNQALVDMTLLASGAIALHTAGAVESALALSRGSELMEAKR